jgi:lysozyme family protein
VKENLSTALDWSRSAEGGFAERKDEPGGAVNKGVSFLVFQEWRKKQGKPTPSLGDLKAITDEEALELYTDKFAKPIHFDDLPSGLDFAMLDIAIMEGVRGSLTLLQQALDLRTVSGTFDMETRGALMKADVPATIAKLTILQMNRKMHAPSVDRFGKGWGDRIVRRYNKARELMQ